MTRPGLRARLGERARALKAESVALYHAARDPRTPWAARLLVAFAVAYALSPIDLIPDFIPVLGMLDDLLLLPLLLALALRLIPEPVMAECRERAAATAARPVSRAAGFMIIMIWLGSAILLGAWAYDSLPNANHQPPRR